MKALGIGLLLVLVLAAGYMMVKGSTTQQPISPAAGTVVVPTSNSKILVKLTADGFNPPTININAGQTVFWQNDSGIDGTVSSDLHPTHLLYPPLNLGVIPVGGEVSLVFDKAGSYGYHNHLNPSMEGKVVVQ